MDVTSQHDAILDETSVDCDARPAERSPCQYSLHPDSDVTGSHRADDTGDKCWIEDSVNSNAKGESRAESSCDLWYLDGNEPFSLSQALSELLMSEDSEQEVVLFHRTSHSQHRRQRNKQKLSSNRTAPCLDSEEHSAQGEAGRHLKRKMKEAEAPVREATPKVPRRFAFQAQVRDNISFEYP